MGCGSPWLLGEVPVSESAASLCSGSVIGLDGTAAQGEGEERGEGTSGGEGPEALVGRLSLTRAFS